MTIVSTRYDVAIIGGGINGASAAQHLASAGYRVFLAEKTTSPKAPRHVLPVCSTADCDIWQTELRPATC
ncbi:FAD-dependent oxidoreductase [Labrenzia sp. DG1229]|uniref:FAD-dependent oxidoreductase n=1 Tax=Labrenzia sp. DG1229 TaxID=681847 RepID=UPI00068A853A